MVFIDGKMESSAAWSRTYLDLNEPVNSISTLEGTLPILGVFFCYSSLESLSSTVQRCSTQLPGLSASNDVCAGGNFLTSMTRFLLSSALNHHLWRNVEDAAW